MILRWVIFLPWLVVVSTIKLFRAVVVLVCAVIAWCIKWILAVVILARHGSNAMDSYLEGCR